MRIQAVRAVRAAFLAVCAAVAPGGVYGADTAWVEESISTHETGSWSQTVLYNRSTGLATFNGGEHTYVPNSPSAGDYVTLNLRMAFSEPDSGTFPGEDAQAAIRIASNGVFSVWTKTGWTDVAAQGITPVSNVEYAVSFVLDYRAGAYSVAVQDSRGDWRRLRSAAGGQSFPLAAKANALKVIEFGGKAKFRSLKGIYTPERPKTTLFCFPDGRRRKKSCFFASPTDGGGKNHAFLLPRQSAEEKTMLFGNTNEKGDEKWQPT